MGEAFTPARSVVTVRRFQYMVAAGVWRDDERIELIEGEILDMAPIGGAQAWTVTRAAEVVRLATGGGAILWVQMPIVLGERSQPQPDLALLRLRPEGYQDRLPAAADVLLVVEVSDTTVDYDRGTKMRLYAANGIPEYWVVDVTERRIEVCRQPGPTGYSSRTEACGAQSLTIATMPGAVLQASSFFAA
jgi:Uma2 family endonuclease